MTRERGAIENLDEAVNLLRVVRPEAAAAYLLGAIPFALGCLYFFADMAENPFAAERLPWESLAVAVLLVWKSVWQAVFVRQLYRHVALAEDQPLPLGSVVAIQCAFQPLSLLAVPLSLLVMIPFAWVVAFFRTVGLCAALGEADPIAVARRQAGLWTKQNWQALALVGLAGLLLFANLLLLLVMLPQIGRSFLGIEGDFARMGTRILNPVTVGVAGALTWLIVDPLLDALYVVRYFHGVSLATGMDLRVALRKWLGKSAGIAALIFISLVAAPCGYSQTQSPAPQAGTMDTGRLDRSIDDVIRRREFAWRSPKPANAKPQGNGPGWLQSAVRVVQNVADWIKQKARDLFHSDPNSPPRGESGPHRPPLELWLAIAAILCAAAVVAAFLRRGRSREVPAQPASPTPAVDIADESVTADRLPESSWLHLADEYLAAGDCRAALRALYLAGLNYLSMRKLVSIRRSKTGREYRRELERAAQMNPQMDAKIAAVFGRNVVLFDRAWYGRYPVEPAQVEDFARGLEEIRRCAAHV